MQRDHFDWYGELRRVGLAWPEEAPRWDETLSDRNRTDIEQAYARLVQGCPRNNQNVQEFAEAAKSSRPVKLGIRMLGREAGTSPTTTYKHFLVKALIKAAGAAEPKAAEAPEPHDIETLEQELRKEKAKVARLQAQNNQLKQANIELEEKVKNMEAAREAAINANRTPKNKSNQGNITPIRR